MISLHEYIVESLLDDVNQLDKKSLKAIKDQINKWIKSNIKKTGGRIKIEQNELGYYNIIYDNSNETFRVDFSNIPDMIKFNIKCRDLYIDSAAEENIFNRFEELNCMGIHMESISGSLGDLSETQHINTLSISNSNITKGDQIKNIIIEDSILINNSNCDLECFKGIKDLKLIISTNTNNTYNLSGIHFRELRLMRNSNNSKPTITLKGNYDVDFLDLNSVNVKGDLPKVINKLKDSHFENLDHFKHIKILFNSWMPYADTREKILNRLESGNLKIDQIIHYQHPYEEIEYEKFITDLQTGICKGHSSFSEERQTLRWSFINIKEHYFKKWLEDNKRSYDVKIMNNDRINLYIITPKKSLIPIAYYFNKYTEFGAANNEIINQCSKYEE